MKERIWALTVLGILILCAYSCSGKDGNPVIPADTYNPPRIHSSIPGTYLGTLKLCFNPNSESLESKFLRNADFIQIGGIDNLGDVSISSVEDLYIEASLRRWEVFNDYADVELSSAVINLEVSIEYSTLVSNTLQAPFCVMYPGEDSGQFLANLDCYFDLGEEDVRQVHHFIKDRYPREFDSNPGAGWGRITEDVSIFVGDVGEELIYWELDFYGSIEADDETYSDIPVDISVYEVEGNLTTNSDTSLSFRVYDDTGEFYCNYTAYTPEVYFGVPGDSQYICTTAWNGGESKWTCDIEYDDVDGYIEQGSNWFYISIEDISNTIPDGTIKLI